jgi:hypothetical protein
VVEANQRRQCIAVVTRSLDRAISVMARGKRISADLRQTIVNLLRSHSHEDVAEKADVSLASVYRIASEMAKTGGFPPPKQRPKGRFRALTEPQFQVSRDISPWPSANPTIVYPRPYSTITRYLPWRAQRRDKGANRR